MAHQGLKLNCVFEINKIIIISHIPEDQMKTDERIYEDLNVKHHAGPGLPVNLNRVSGVGEFLCKLDEIFEMCRSFYLRPALHIECHGSENSGLQFQNGWLSWERLGEKLRAINFASGCNLVVSMATCYGVNAYLAAFNHNRICPAFYLFAPQDKRETGDLYQFFIGFYNMFSETDNMAEIDEFVESCSDVAGVFSPRIIITAIAKHLYKNCRGKGKQERVEHLTTLSKWVNADNKIESIRKYRNLAKDFITIDEEIFIKYAQAFLLNEVKIGCSWEELRGFVLQE